MIFVAVLSVDLIIVSFSTIFHSNVFSILYVSISLNRNVIYFLRNNFDQHSCHDGAIWLPTTTRNWNWLIIWKILYYCMYVCYVKRWRVFSTHSSHAFLRRYRIIRKIHAKFILWKCLLMSTDCVRLLFFLINCSSLLPKSQK